MSTSKSDHTLGKLDSHHLMKWKSRDQRTQKKKATSGQQTVTRATRVKRSRTRVPSRSSGSGTWYILSDLGMEWCAVRAQGSEAGTQWGSQPLCSVLSLAVGWGESEKEATEPLSLDSYCPGLGRWTQTPVRTFTLHFRGKNEPNLRLGAELELRRTGSSLGPSQ